MNERFTDAAAEDMWARLDVVWSLFAVRERDLGVLGDVHDLDVVGLACDTAYFSAWLARVGATTTVAVDLSGEQLATARRLQGQLGPVLPFGAGVTTPRLLSWPPRFTLIGQGRTHRGIVLAVELASAHGALGARMTGGGFGGSAIALVPTDSTAEVTSAVIQAFADKGFGPPLLRCHRGRTRQARVTRNLLKKGIS